MKLKQLSLILAVLWTYPMSAYADGLNPVTPYYNCYMELTPYNELPQELIGPRVIQHKTFNWIKSHIVLRYTKKSGQYGFYLVTPKAYYFSLLPTNFRQALTNTPLFFDLIIPQKAGETPTWIHMSISPTEVKSQETAKGFPPVTFPEGAAFTKMTLYESIDPEFFAAFGEDLKYRIGTIYKNYQKIQSAGKASGAWQSTEYLKALQSCLQVKDPQIQLALQTEISKFAFEPSSHIQSPTPGGSPVPGAQQAVQAVTDGGYIPLFLRPYLNQVPWDKLQRLLPENPRNLMKYAWILVVLLAIRVLFHSYFKGLKTIKEFCRAYELKPKNNAKKPTYEGMIKNHPVFISHESMGSSNRSVTIEVSLQGLPSQLEIRLKSRSYAKFALNQEDERKTDALDDEFFEKYVLIKSAKPDDVNNFLTSWRKSILRQCMGKMDVSLINSKLVYRHPTMISDFDKLESIIHSLLNTAVLLTPR